MKLKTQRGYMEDLGSVLITLAIVCAVLGYVVLRTGEWLWPFVKAMIHEATK